VEERQVARPTWQSSATADNVLSSLVVLSRMRAMKTNILASVISLLVAVGCSKDKPATESTVPSNAQPAEAQPVPADGEAALVKDLEMMCNAFELASAPKDSGMTVVGPWLEKNLQTADGKALLESMKTGGIEPAKQEVERRNITPCPMFDAQKS
jgi:hypothetical protein